MTSNYCSVGIQLKLSIKFPQSARLTTIIQVRDEDRDSTHLVSSNWELLSDFSCPNKIPFVSQSTFFFSPLQLAEGMAGLLHTTSALCDNSFVLVSLQLSHYCKCRRHACYPLKGIWLDLRGNGASVTKANFDNGRSVHVWKGHAANYQCPPYT